MSFETDFLPLTLKLATTTPLSTEVLSLRPLQLAQLSGEANVEASVTGAADLPLLSSKVRAQIEGDQAVLNASGSLSPEALLPLLENGPWEGSPGLAIIEEAGGEIFFEASAVLPGMKENTPVRGNEQLWLENANLTIKPGSELRVGAVTDPQTQAPWSRVGWQQALATLKVEAPLTLSTEGWPGNLRLSATDIQGTLQEKKGEPAVNFQLSEATCDFAGTTECATAIQANSPQLTFKDSGVTVNDLVLSSSLTFTAGKQQNEIRVSDFFAKATSVTSGPVQATGLLVTASAGRCLNMDKKIHCESAPQVTAESVKTADPAIELGGTVAIAPIKLTRLEDKLEFHAQYDIAEASVRWEDGGEVNFNGTGELSLTDTLLRGTGQISTGDIRAQSNWSHNLETTSGSAKLELPRISFSEEEPLSKSITGLPVDLVAGALSATAHMSWPADAKDQVQLSLDGVAGVYDKSFATGINTSLRLLRAGDNWVTADPQPVSIDAVDVGIGIKDIHFDLSITEQRDIVLSSLSAKLLEGEINSESLTWNLDDQPRRSLLSASGISLRALEKEMEAENFAASGTLDLQIPVITGPDGITVEAGKVEARPPGGRLRYYGAFSPAMLAGNPQLKMLSGALEDYSFRTLGGTLNYPPSGDMQLQLKLVGRSDSVAKDRDLIINLNLENNVPSMLRSLQASRDLSEALQKNLE
ncbi:intermembrane phospholipid transport protein YdbH family protein [Microbulbifer aggregans]|uniref:intermembrane phospholipid transport protein YdbH family protein n=1 Tax=Microbulbifer aggregans TaxID=1769779 RepID=UPI0011AB8E1E|nr:YdbH domain-containing protein [Microbulbifer aggregans]